ncbi:MAG: 2-oxo-4-hydroxy-4-carboxy-5-ureidoimidazoline decarboxylase, partial [Hylemonella sp.]
RGHTRASIIALFEQRLANDRASEIQECLRQVYRIGLLRLQDLLQHPA